MVTLSDTFSVSNLVSNKDYRVHTTVTVTNYQWNLFYGVSQPEKNAMKIRVFYSHLRFIRAPPQTPSAFIRVPFLGF